MGLAFLDYVYNEKLYKCKFIIQNSRLPLVALVVLDESNNDSTLVLRAGVLIHLVCIYSTTTVL